MKDFDNSCLEPDVNNLDEEWVKQSKLYFTFAEQCETVEYKLAKKEQEISVAQEELKKIAAEIDLDIRKRPEKYSLPEKTTETMIAKAVLLQPRYDKKVGEINVLIEEKNKLAYKAGLLQKTIKAIEQKKAALENLVSLWIGNYYSTPKAKEKEAKEVMNEVEKKQARSKVSKLK